MSIVVCLSSLYFLVDPAPGYWAFLLILNLRNVGVAYIDALAEGISSVVTKETQKIQHLKAELEEDDEDEKDTSLQAIGILNSVRAFFLGTMSFVGGVVVESTPDLRWCGIILTSYPLIMVFLVLFVFKEDKVINHLILTLLFVLRN